MLCMVTSLSSSKLVLLNSEKRAEIQFKAGRWASRPVELQEENRAAYTDPQIARGEGGTFRYTVII